MNQNKLICKMKLFFFHIGAFFMMYALGVNELCAQYTNEWYSNNYKILTSLYNGELGYFDNVPKIDTSYLNFVKAKLDINYSALISITDTDTNQNSISEVFDYMNLDQDSIDKIEQKNVAKTINETIKKNELIDRIENLYYCTNIYDLIKEQTNVLEPILSKLIFEDKVKSEKLFALYGLLNINDFKRSEFIKIDKVPNYIKVRLDDSYSLNLFKEKLAKTLADSLFSDQLENLLIQMFYIDSQELWDIYFDNLQSIHYQKYYFDCNQVNNCKREWSLAYLLLKAYKKYYPFELEYFEKYIFNNTAIPDKRETVVYFLAVSKFLGNKYNRKINIRTYFMGREN